METLEILSLAVIYLKSLGIENHPITWIAIYNRVFDVHLQKHYSLWKILLNKKNKSIIKNTLYDQLKSSINSKNNLTEYGILELLEYENRQTKHVVNGQRIYDYYKLDWLLPLWNNSFIKFWQRYPI